MLNFANYEAITFDCYGTLIDWETGLWNSLCPILESHHVVMEKEKLLELYGELEAEIEAGEFVNYKTILRLALEGIGCRLNFLPTAAELEAFPLSVKAWPAFADSPRALQALKKKYKLVILSNIDDDLISGSIKHLQTPFDWVITAEQLHSYKPSLNNFHQAIERIGMPKEKVLHVAQSLYHDIAPAKSLGISTVWVNRRHDKEGFGATPPSDVQPDLEIPDLKTLACMIGLL